MGGRPLHVLQLKEKIAQSLPESAEVESLRLIFTDKMLEENSKPLVPGGLKMSLQPSAI
uniref:Ubiquitin-like domain-containing protein n=1 Tax=Oryzias latipes TaxID=8090 RepID=A0A3B3I4Y4_ORYLA